MFTNIQQQQPNIQTNVTSLTEDHVDNNILPMPVYDQEIISWFQKNKNLPCVCEQLPHHCVQLCLLS